MTTKVQPFRSKDLFTLDMVTRWMTRRADMTIAELMEPGFLPKKTTLQADDIVVVRGLDGMALTFVADFLPTGEPVLRFVQTESPRRGPGRPPKDTQE